MIQLHPEILAGVALATVRIILGLLFIFQGYDKAFRLSRRELSNFIPQEIAGKVPGGFSFFLIRTGAWLELIGGFLLVTGIFIHPALLILAIDLVAVTLAFSIAVPVWDLRHVFPRLIMLIFLLLSPTEADIFSTDYFIRNT